MPGAGAVHHIRFGRDEARLSTAGLPPKAEGLGDLLGRDGLFAIPSVTRQMPAMKEVCHAPRFA